MDGTSSLSTSHMHVASDVTHNANNWNMSFGTCVGCERVYNPAVSAGTRSDLSTLQPIGLGASVVAVSPKGKVLLQASLCSLAADKYSIVHTPVCHQRFIWRHSVVTVYILGSKPAKLLALLETEQ